MKRFTTLLLAIVMVLSCALTLIACGGDDVTTTATTTTASTTTSTTTTTKKQGGGENNPVIIPKPPKDFEGEGTEEDPFIIDSKETLLKLVEKSSRETYSGQYFKQTADIVLNDTSVANWYEAETAEQWGVIKQFAGTYDGDGHVIEGLLIDKEWNENYVNMMLGFIGEGLDCTVKNLAFRGLRIVVTYGDGANGTITQASVGGIVAFTHGDKRKTATIENCMVECYIDAVGANNDRNPSGGALFGFLGGGFTVKNCFAIGEVNTNHGVLGSGGMLTCDMIGVVSVLTSRQGTIGDWSSGITCQNIYVSEGGPALGGAGWNFDESCAKVAVDAMLGDGAKAACPGLDFEETWQANEGKLPSLKVFGDKMIFDAPAVAPAE